MDRLSTFVIYDLHYIYLAFSRKGGIILQEQKVVERDLERIERTEVHNHGTTHNRNSKKI